MGARHTSTARQVQSSASRHNVRLRTREPIAELGIHVRHAGQTIKFAQESCGASIEDSLCLHRLAHVLLQSDRVLCAELGVPRRSGGQPRDADRHC
jgi:hypothetical protein